ncbi:MAG: response regulator, partial [Armatimonadota bacterium]|nr:response regulator [Armatimonadota bacterium]
FDCHTLVAHAHGAGTGAAGAGRLLAAVVRGRERVLRRQKLQLESTVRERTSELRQKNHAIEQMNGELRVARDAAEASRRAKAQFLANMSHEIRTPMNAVIGLTNLLQQTPTNPEQSEYLTAIGSSSQNLLVILNDILDSSKMEAGKLTLEQVAFRLPDAVRGLATLFRYAADSKGLDLCVEVANDVPLTVIGDPVRLQQILVNLVSNALKFTRQGSVTVRVATAPGPAAVAGRVALQFEVQDTGIGIPADKLTAIFEDFSQANASTTREYGGTGLGLTISSQIVSMMHGRIGVDSEVGKGTTFHFTGNFRIATGAAVTRIPVEPAGLLEQPVLIVDDNYTNRCILTEMVSHWGMKPTAVDGSKAALEAIEQAAAAGEKFAAMLLDVNMPEMDGFALAAAIQQKPGLADTKLLMLTSADRRGDSSRSRELGVASYLMKPIKQSDLMAAMQMALGTTTTDTPTAGNSSLPGDQAPLNILLAEDNAVNQALAVHVLEKIGHHVTIAPDGKQAVQAVQGGAYDLVLMDVQMPEMDGFEATQTIREWEKSQGGHIPIVAMTAHAMKGDRERCLAAGMDGYTSKPLHARDLFDALRELGPLLPAHGIEPPDEAPAAAAHEAGPAHDGTIQWDDLLYSFEDDMDILHEITGTFLQNCPDQVANVKNAIIQQDSQALERTAHCLKGTLATFRAGPATEIA